MGVDAMTADNAAEWPPLRVAKERCPLYRQRLLELIKEHVTESDAWIQCSALTDTLFTVPAEAIKELEAKIALMAPVVEAALAYEDCHATEADRYRALVESVHAYLEATDG